MAWIRVALIGKEAEARRYLFRVQSEGKVVTVDGDDVLLIDPELFEATMLAMAGGTEPTVGVASKPGVERTYELMKAVEELQIKEGEQKRSLLLQAMIVAGIDPVPVATTEQALKLASHRTSLLASGAYTVEALVKLRQAPSEGSIRTWLTRKRQAGQLFTITHDNQLLVPAFQLDEELEPRVAVMAVLAELAHVDLGGWATWTWFTSRSSWLGDRKPVELLDSNTDRAITAARRFASNAA